MPHKRLACDLLRPRLAAFLAGTEVPALEAHLAVCGACRERLLEEALRQAPPVRVPEGFGLRLLGRVHADAPPPRSVLPYATAAAGLLSLAFAAVTPSFELTAALQGVSLLLARMGDPRLLLGLLAAEGILCLAWLWQAARA